MWHCRCDDATTLVNEGTIEITKWKNNLLIYLMLSNAWKINRQYYKLTLTTSIKAKGEGKNHAIYDLHVNPKSSQIPTLSHILC